MSSYYHLKNIRMLLTEGFSREELLELCFDEPQLRDVYDNWAGLANKGEFVRQVIDHAHKRLALDVILDWASKRNRLRFDRHQPYRRADTPETPASSSTDLANAGLVLANNDLGRGLTLGGAYRGIPLKLLATEWEEYGAFGWVRSGWLFIPQWTASHAVAFFKVHVTEDGRGYIHIVDVANPEHVIWLTTNTGFKEEKTFHYVTHPVDLWSFTWKEIGK